MCLLKKACHLFCVIAHILDLADADFTVPFDIFLHPLLFLVVSVLVAHLLEVKSRAEVSKL